MSVFGGRGSTRSISAVKGDDLMKHPTDPSVTCARRYPLPRLLVLSLALAACGADEDATASAAVDVQRSLAMDGILDLIGPKGLVPGGDAPTGLHCDDAPELLTASPCGEELVTEAHFAWSGCEVDHPGERPDVVSDGSFDLVRELPEGLSCDPGELVEVATEADFAVELDLSNGRSAAMSGSILAVSERTIGSQGYTRSATLAVDRAIYEDGDLLRKIAIAGQLNVAIAAAEGGPTRTVDGSLTITPDDSESVGEVTLVGVVHEPLSECAWPIAGELLRARPGGETHHLVFGPGCGEATIDGESVDLTEAQAGGPRRGHGRPF